MLKYKSMSLPVQDQDDDAIVCLVACPNDDVAEMLGRTLVVERLAACVNVIPGVRSIYRWRGSITDDVEVLCLVKTTRAFYERVRARIVALHPYDIPEVLTLDVGQGHAPYLEWLRASVGEE